MVVDNGYLVVLWGLLLCFLIAECKGVLRAGVDAGTKEEPRAARIHQTAGEQDAPPRQRLHTCQTGIVPVTGLYTWSVCTFSFLSTFSYLEYHSSICLASLLKGSFKAVIRSPASCPTSNPPRGPNLSPSPVSGYNPSSSILPAPSNPEAGWQERSLHGSTPLGALGDSHEDVNDLKEQLEALKCQVGCSLQHSIKTFSHFWCDESRADVNPLLPGKDLLNAKTWIRRWTAPPSGGSVPFWYLLRA